MMASSKGGGKAEEEVELRRGPWTIEEDTLLIHYIACHGEGRWNLLAKCSGLKRTGKSCRLRWLNYLKPDVKRGNLTPEEQILILELHSKWGNRWSRIAQHLPGRTDNEIKNYWRTRVQKHARQLKVDANSDVFRDAVRCFWMPRLVEKMGASQQLQTIRPSPGETGGYYDPADAPRLVESRAAVVDAHFKLQFNPSEEQQGVLGNMTNREALMGGASYAIGAAVGGESVLGSTAGGDCKHGCTMIEGDWGDVLWSNNTGEDQLWHLRQMHEWAL